MPLVKTFINVKVESVNYLQSKESDGSSGSKFKKIAFKYNNKNVYLVYYSTQ